MCPLKLPYLRLFFHVYVICTYLVINIYYTNYEYFFSRKFTTTERSIKCGFLFPLSPKRKNSLKTWKCELRQISIRSCEYLIVWLHSISSGPQPGLILTSDEKVDAKVWMKDVIMWISMWEAVIRVGCLVSGKGELCMCMPRIKR